MADPKVYGTFGGSASNVPSAKPRDGLHSELVRLVTRLADVARGIDQSADAIHGPVPAEIQGDANASPPNIAGVVRHLGEMIGRCENATKRLYDGL